MAKRISKPVVQSVLDIMHRGLSQWRIEQRTNTTWGRDAKKYEEGYLDGYEAALGTVQYGLDKMED